MFYHCTMKTITLPTRTATATVTPTVKRGPGRPPLPRATLIARWKARDAADVAAGRPTVAERRRAYQRAYSQRRAIHAAMPKGVGRLTFDLLTQGVSEEQVYARAREEAARVRAADRIRRRLAADEERAAFERRGTLDALGHTTAGMSNDAVWDAYDQLPDKDRARGLAKYRATLNEKSLTTP